MLVSSLARSASLTSVILKKPAAFSRNVKLLQKNWCKINVSTLSNVNADTVIAIAVPSTDGISSKISGKIFTTRERLGQYGELSKFRLSSLVVLTTFSGFACAGALPLDWSAMAMACFGTGLCAASASTFNQIIEVERDAAMKRTLARPLPSGKISLPYATTFGAATGVCGVSMLMLGTNSEVAMLGATNIALYSVAYTYSKQHTEFNTWVGSLVGALPPIMGWAAATNGIIVGAEPLALGALLYLWQFPHFFALSWMYREDYKQGGFQMISVNDPQGQRLSRLILEYSAYLAAFPVLASCLGLTSPFFAVEGCLANLYLMRLAHKFSQDRTNYNARNLFLCTLWYLPALLTLFVLHSRMWQDDDNDEDDEEKGKEGKREGNGGEKELVKLKVEAV